MSAVPASAYLVDFGADPELGANPAFALLPRIATSADAARLEQARADGFESGRAAGEVALDARLAEQRAAFERQLAAERKAWACQEGEVLAQRLSAGLKEIEAKIADATARVLAPFLTAELRRQAVADLRRDLEILLAKEAGIALSISGPKDLLDALRSQLADGLGAIAYLPNEACDVRVSAGQTVLQTRLEGWVGKIEGAVR